MIEVTENRIAAVGRALLAYRDDLTASELVGMSHDAIAALNRLESGKTEEEIDREIEEARSGE